MFVVQAGELGLDIYALSLSAIGCVSSPTLLTSFLQLYRNVRMDDGCLSRIVSSLPSKAILLIEDIDCAFPSREEMDAQIHQSESAPYQLARSKVTLSGLLNVLDGINSGNGTDVLCWRRQPR